MSSSTFSLASTLPLINSSYRIPRFGFGVYLSPPPACVKSCLRAFEVGYRHIDTAIYYDNEKSVGRAVKESEIPRGEIFLTSKILSPGKDVESTFQSIKQSVEKLVGEGGYADLFLIHSPNGGAEARRLMWLALELAKERGIVRDIGVSNYGIAHIEEIKKIGKIWPPVVNQIELHPWCQQREIVQYCKDNGIVVEQYCPIVRNQKAHDPTLNKIANKHDKTTTQVLIRYGLHKDWVTLPKSDDPLRIRNNANVFDFELDEQDLKDLDGLDQGAKGAIVQAVKNEI